MASAVIDTLVNLLLLPAAAVVVTGVGGLALRAAGVAPASRAERHFFAFGAGLAATGYAVFVPAALRVLGPAALWALVALLALASAFGWRTLRSPGPAPAAGLSLDAPRPLLERAAVLLLAGLLAVDLALALAPETGKDALIYHLAVPREYLKRGGFYFLPGNVFASYPLLGEMAYIPALFLRGEVFAKLLHFGALAGVLAGMRSFSTRHVPENAFPWTCLLVFAAVPTVFAVSHTANVDLFVVLYVLAALFAYANWTDERRGGWLALSGAFTGAALSCKYTALLLPFLGVLGILVEARRRGASDRDALGDLLRYLAPAAVLGAPFYLKNLALTGNPFYPFLYGLFGGKGWDAEQARLYDALVAHLGMGRGWLDYLLLPWNVSLRAQADSPRFDGVVGPVFLFALPFLAGVRRVPAALKGALVLSLLWFLFWASSAQLTRYLLPVFPFLAVAVGVALTWHRSRPGRWPYRLLAAVVTAGLAFSGYHIAREFGKTAPLGVIVGAESRADYLGRVVPVSRMYGYLDRHLPARSKVFLIYMRNYTFLCRTECYSDAMFESYTIQKILSRSRSAGEVRDALRAGGFTHLMYDGRYVFGDLSTFTREEQELFGRFQAEDLVLLHEEGPFRLFRIADALPGPPPGSGAAVGRGVEGARLAGRHGPLPHGEPEAARRADEDHGQPPLRFPAEGDVESLFPPALRAGRELLRDVDPLGSRLQ
ncbi:MAG: ArnT family glycosyltransferase [Gemmatimonadota bacterium]